jgi:hypothetical protein
MKRLIIDQEFSFDEKNKTDVWIIGPPLPAFKLLIHIDFYDKINSPFEIFLTFISQGPEKGIQSPYQFKHSLKSYDLLIEKPEIIANEMISIIQVECKSEFSLKGKVSFFEINKENRFEIAKTMNN